jgi:hypothetical protein
VKLLKIDQGEFVFHLGKRENLALLDVLKRFPLVPPAHHALRHSAAAAAEGPGQALLEEVLDEHRRENQRHLLALLKSRQRWQPAHDGCRLTLSAPDVEWLLQVLNDVRVGSWIRLGAPEKSLWDFDLNAETAPHAWAMETAGYFQMHLLEALATGRAT